MGQVPHTSPKRVFASEVYKAQFAQWVDRLGVPNLSFKTFVPELCLAGVAKKHGYRTIARVSMPVLNPYAGLTRGFDDYKLMSNHNDFAGMVKEIEFPRGERRFYFLNLGETHYPYMLDDKTLPKISGVHGIARGWTSFWRGAAIHPRKNRNSSRLKQCDSSMRSRCAASSMSTV